MELRNLLLIISIVMIGFCLSLYFQTEIDSIPTVNIDQYKNLQYNDERSHSLADLNTKLTPYRLETQIQEIFEKNRLAGEKTRVMEIGTGNGRVLMELKKIFPEVEFYGINKEKTLTFYRRESYILTGLKFGIFQKDEIEGIELPYMIFHDLDFGKQIPYDENKFDLVFSQNTLSHIKYKFELLNSVMKILKPGGLSFHTDMNGVNIYSEGIIMEQRDAFAEIRRRGIDTNTLESKSSIRFKKSQNVIFFPLSPHQPLPENLDNLPQELRRPEMGYNIDI